MPQHRLAPAVLLSLLALGALGSQACGSSSDDPQTSGGGGASGGQGGGGQGGAADPKALWTSGKRLRATVTDAGGGLARFVAWQDTQRNERCSFARTPEGVRCVPGVAALATQFGDAQCTQRIVQAPCGPPPTRALVLGAACELPRVESVHAVGAKTDGSVYERDAKGACVLVGTSNVDVYAVGEPIALASFVSASETVEPRAKPFEVRVLAGDDGSRQTVVVRDTGLGAPVRPAVATDGTTRWLPAEPAPLVDGTSYVDAACKEPAARAGAECAPKHAWTLVSATCAAPQREVRELGPKLGAFHAQSQGTCKAFTDTAYAGYAVGAVVPPATFQAVTLAPAGSSRLKAKRPVDADGTALGDDQPVYDDSERGDTCAAGIAADGKERCIPQGAAELLSGYADPACTVRAARWEPGCNAPMPTLAAGPSAPGTTTCPGPTLVLALGAPLGSPTVYAKNAAGACGLSVVTGSSTAMYFATSTEIAPTSLVEIVTRTE